MPRRLRLRRALLAAAAVAGAGLGLLVLVSGVLDEAELDLLDARVQLRADRPAPDDLLLVVVDDVTFAETGLPWPFPRRLHAQVIDRLREAGARRIGVDIQFTERTTERDDDALIRAVARAPGTVLATTETDEAGRTSVLGGDDVLREVGAVAGNGLVPVDEDGVYRRFETEVGGLPTFAWLLAGRPDVGRDEVLLDPVGPPGSLDSVSYVDVLEGRVPDREVAGRTVLIGPSAPVLQDVKPTAAGGGLMAGVEIQGNAVDTFRRGAPLRETGGLVDALLVLVLGLLGPLAAATRRPLLARLAPVGALAGYLGAAWVLFDAADLIVPVAVPVLALVTGAVGALAADLVTSAVERERVLDLFGRFVPESVVDEVVARAEDGVRLGGDARVATVMFCDLRGFTTFSDGREPTDVIEVVNRYLGEMSEAILDHGGTLIAYMGDGIFAAFGIPLDQPDHADRALAAAREMVAWRLPRFNAALAADGLGPGFRMGIGLHTGLVVSGNVGSQRRLEYTAIGDTTNAAARIEGMTKGAPFQLLLSEATRAALADPPADLVDAGEVELRGKAAPMRVWSIEAAR